MKLVLFTLIALVAFAAAQHRCESPSVFEARSFSYDHHTGYFSAGRLAYDGKLERVRVIHDVYENSTEDHFDTLYAFKEKAEYRVNLKTKKCVKSSLTENFFPMGVYPNSTYAGSFILGSLNAPGTGVVVQEWYHKTAEGGYWIQLFTEHGCIPVQTLMFGKNSAGNEVHYHHDYMDVTLGVKDRAIFDVPKECL